MELTDYILLGIAALMMILLLSDALNNRRNK
jgi:hypothetical protein